MRIALAITPLAAGLVLVGCGSSSHTPSSIPPEAQGALASLQAGKPLPSALPSGRTDDVCDAAGDLAYCGTETFSGAVTATAPVGGAILVPLSTKTCAQWLTGQPAPDGSGTGLQLPGLDDADGHSIGGDLEVTGWHGPGDYDTSSLTGEISVDDGVWTVDPSAQGTAEVKPDGSGSVNLTGLASQTGAAPLDVELTWTCRDAHA